MSEEVELEPLEHHAFQSQVANQLDQVRNAGQFHHAEVLEAVPTPAVNIVGHGNIAFPLSEHDTQLITSASRAFHHPNSVEDGNIWKIKSEHLIISNPAWNKFLQAIALRLRSTLGLHGGGSVCLSLVELIFIKSGTDTCDIPRYLFSFILARYL